MKENITAHELLKRKRELLARQLEIVKARSGFLAFLKYVWWMPHELIIGRHTRIIAHKLDLAMEREFRGENTFYDIKLVFRHGKSDLCSRAFPAYFIARVNTEQDRLKKVRESWDNGDESTLLQYPEKEDIPRYMDPEVIIASYNKKLVRGFSNDIRKIIRSQRFRILFPNVRLKPGRNTVDEWGIDDSAGIAIFVGLNEGATGRGATYWNIDDSFGNFADARSETIRDNVWETIISILTRRYDPSIGVHCATEWHIDGPSGRIKKLMEKEPNAPRFETISFPYINPPDVAKIHGKYLFPQRFSEDWYEGQRAFMGEYWAAALMLCNPLLEGGDKFAVNKIHWHRSDEKWPEMRKMRVWDVASTEKQTNSDSPDWTAGVRGSVIEKVHVLGTFRIPYHEVWIDHIAFCQEESTARKQLILKTAISDGPMQIVHEDYGPYKDGFTELRDGLKGVRHVSGFHKQMEKVSKWTGIAIAMETGNFHIKEGPWKEEFLNQFTPAPNGSHDDFVDAAAILFHMFVKPQTMLALPGAM